MSEEPGDEPARAAALRLLARREHTRRELLDKLAQRGFAEAQASPVLDALAEEGLLDESRFAEAFVRSRIQRGQGPLRIEQEMRRRGLPGALADEALAAAEVDWQAQARAVRAQRFGEQPPAGRREVQRQAQFLQRRGFTAEQARAATLGAEDDDEKGPVWAER